MVVFHTAAEHHTFNWSDDFYLIHKISVDSKITIDYEIHMLKLTQGF